MDMLKRINKGVGAAATAIVLVGGTPVVVQAMPNNTDIPKLEAKTICRNMEKSIKNGKYKVNNLNEKFYSNMNISSQNQKESNKKEEVNIKVLQEKSDATSMAGGYIKKVEHEIVNGKQYLILSIDSIDWMSNITAAIDGSEEIKVDEIERSAKKVADGKGKQVGKIKFEIKDLSSKILMHMNVEPMGNNRVAFRIISVNVNDDEHNKNKTSNEEIKKDENKVKDNKKETNKKENLEKGDSKEKQDLNKKSIEDGIYTIGFEAYHLENPEASSMLGNFFDKNVKLEVKNGKKKITMLNTCFADGVLDYRIGSNNIFKESIGMWYGNVNEDGKYPYKTYEMEISELEDDYIACVLAGPMGGVKKDIGDFSKYKQAKIVFNKEYKKGWSGFERDKKVIDYNKNLTKALIEAGVDKDGNGIITEGEIASIKDELDISVKGIKDISLLKNLGSSIKRLYLIGNHIDKLPEGIFDNLTNLEVLYLNGNIIKELPKGIFDKLTNLKELQLNQNMIEEIPSGIFDKLVNLKSLVISDNPLKEADFSTLNKLNKLEYLSIENCNLREMPKEIFKLCKLKTLNASKNDITIIPKEISALKELKEMNFSINYIEEIPEEVYTKLPNLEKLQINDNLVKYIPLDVFYKAPKLRSLDFIMNKLDKIPQIPEEFKGKKSIWAYPQKTYMDIKLSAENGKISWKQNLSGMDMIVWKMIHPSGKTATTLDEFKKDFENKEILELMHSNSCEPTVKTVIQKKDSNGEYITLKEIIYEDKIDLPEVVEDKNMKKGDQYRIIKTVSARSYSMDVYVLRDVAYAKAISECSSTGAKHNVVKEEKTKNINMKILKEKSNEPSMAAQYVDKSVKYIEKAGKKYFTVTLNRMDWMKNVQIEAGGKEVVATKNENGNIGEFTFEVENENSEVTMRMNVVPMNNARVAFRLVNTNVAGKDNKQDKEKLQRNNKDEQEVRIKTLPNVKSSRYGEIYGRLEYEIMVEDSKYINIVDYTRSISEVTVNGVKYQRDFSLGINKYYFGLSGALELNEDEFTKEVNKIVLKSNKYNTMIINVKKDGTLVDSKEIKSEKNKINTPPMLEVGNPLKIELGNKVDLMEGVSAIDEEDGEITKNIKIDCGKLNIDNPIKGIYNVTYSITDTKGETVTKIREIQITGKEVSVDNLEDGIYTLNFTARRIDDETRSSMLEDFFDRNIKVTVKNGKIVLNMLNIMHANTLYDLRIESNNKFNKTTSKYYGQPNPKDGSYKMQIFEVPMDSLKGSHVGGVLVGMMGGYKTQIGNMDNYTKVKFIFSDKCTKGWDGFITKEDKLNYDENLSKALLKLELDKNKDGNVSNEEIALAEGVISLNQKELKDISKLKYMGNKVTSLQLNGNYIETLPQGIFDNLTELKELTINSNLLQSLDEHIFDKLTKLEYLTMDSNKLRRLPENIFSKLVNLKTIGFTGNQLQELPDNLFHNNNKLEELYLGNNKLKALPKSLSTLPNLKSLYLEDNELTLVPIEFKKFKNLEKLNISNNKITNIPEEVYKKLNKLKELDLSDNKLTHIPSDIENIMPNLKRL
ncbi:DUF1533 domain-containing protein [Clostridium botulinum]|nr:DUF1533 domain-containing protein [Clostridium botulinum]